MLSEISSAVLPYALRILICFTCAFTTVEETKRRKRPYALGSIVHYEGDKTTPRQRGEQRTKRSANHTNTKKHLARRTKYVQPALPLDEPLRSRLRPTRVREVDREPDQFARVLSHPFLFHPPDRMFRLFLAPRGKVHLCAASY